MNDSELVSVEFWHQGFGPAFKKAHIPFAELPLVGQVFEVNGCGSVIVDVCELTAHGDALRSFLVTFERGEPKWATHEFGVSRLLIELRRCGWSAQAIGCGVIEIRSTRTRLVVDANELHSWITDKARPRPFMDIEASYSPTTGRAAIRLMGITDLDLRDHRKRGQDG